jgi:Rod binding domain-containing protein
MDGIFSSPDVSTSIAQDNRREESIKIGKPLEEDVGREEKIERLKKLREACAGIEAVFVGSLIKAMRQTIPENGLLDKHPGSDIYEGLMDEKLADFLTDKVGMGLGQILFNQMVHREDLGDVAETEASSLGIEYEKLVPPDHKKRNGIWDGRVMRPAITGTDGKKVPATDEINEDV